LFKYIIIGNVILINADFLIVSGYLCLSYAYAPFSALFTQFPFQHSLDIMALNLYIADHVDHGTDYIKEQLELLSEGSALTKPEYLSPRTRRWEPERAQKFLGWYAKKLSDTHFEGGLADNELFQKHVVGRIELCGFMAKGDRQ
jgi:hypothetical protein